MEPTWMNKHPMSAVQSVFEQSPWQKERLTHSQLREQPRHRKETQQSWMKANPTQPARIWTQSRYFTTDAEHTTSTKKKKMRRWHKQTRTMCNPPLDWPHSTARNQNWPTCAMGTESKFHLSGCETIDDTFAGNATQTAALNPRAAGNSG